MEGRAEENGSEDFGMQNFITGMRMAGRETWGAESEVGVRPS